MHDAQRLAIVIALLVGIMERSGHVTHDGESVFEGYAVTARVGPFEQAPQVFAVQIFHGEEISAVDLADIVDLTDVLMVELAGQAGLVEEQAHELGIAAAVGQ